MRLLVLLALALTACQTTSSIPSSYDPLAQAPVTVKGGVAPPQDGLGRYFARLAERRQQQLLHLVQYAGAGKYPENHLGRKLLPFFVDQHGVRCAVGHLMERDGLGPAVEAIAAADNHVRVADVRDGPLVRWIRSSGLLQKECASIQPTYSRTTPLAAAERERLRVKEHLSRAYMDCVVHGFYKLCQAFELCIPDIRDQIDAPATGFVQGLCVVSIHNGCPVEIEIRRLQFDHGLYLVQVGGWRKIAADERVRYPWSWHNSFIEWRAAVAIPAEARKVTLATE